MFPLMGSFKTLFNDQTFYIISFRVARAFHIYFEQTKIFVRKYAVLQGR